MASAFNIVWSIIIETCLLTEEEKIKVCELSVKAGAAFVKTSTGFSTGGATPEDVALMKKTVGDKALVKANQTGISHVFEAPAYTWLKAWSPCRLKYRRQPGLPDKPAHIP